MIQTQFGAVGLRRPRKAEKIKLRGAGDISNSKEKTIAQGWLKSDKPKAKDEKTEQVYRTQHLQEYRMGVKQAMLIAAAQIDLEDMQMVNPAHPDMLPNNMPRTADNIRQLQNRLKQKEMSMRDGTAPVPLKSLAKDATIATQGHRLTKHPLWKRSHKCGMKKWRFFTVNNGRLHVFKYNKDHLKPSKVYDLKDAKCTYQTSRTPNPAEKFEKDYDYRVVVQCQERLHGPMYLYTKDSKQGQAWERAIKMSKYLQSPSDREALAVVVGRVAGGIAKKGWDALFNYAKEITQTRARVKNLAMRLKQVELSKGWTKLRLIFKHKVAAEKLRQEQQEWAAKFLKEKMDRINQDAARPPQAVRNTIISQIQSKFRHFREEKIFDRAYPLGTSVRTRTQQALGGSEMGSCFATLKHNDVAQIAINPDVLSQLGMAAEAVLQSRKSTYSEVTLPVGRSNVRISDSLTMLSFSSLSEQELNALESGMTKEQPKGWNPGNHLMAFHSAAIQAGHASEGAESDWASFVNLDQISSVVLHAERQMLSKEGKQKLTPSVCMGTWLTINGPRVGWGRKIQSGWDEQNNVEVKYPVGAADGVELGAALARGERTKWFRLSLLLSGAQVPKVAPINGERDDENGGAKPRKVQFVVHLLGRKFTTKPVDAEGGNPQVKENFDAEVPVANDPGALAALDDTEVGIDVVEWNEEPSLCRVSWAGKMKLWKVFAPPERITEVAKNAYHHAQTALGVIGEVPEPVHSLAETFGSQQQLSQNHDLSLQRATAGAALDMISHGKVSLQFQARIEPPSPQSVGRCISPELSGRGSLTALYTTQRGAWYDPKLGESKFVVDHVANFAEFKLDALDFPSKDMADASRMYKYHVEASCNGVPVRSVALHRARPNWSDVIAVDPQRISFMGYKLFVPLPPGFWSKQYADQGPCIDFTVFRCAETDGAAKDYRSFLAASRTEAPAPKYEKVYEGRVLLDGGEKDRGITVDQTRSKLEIVLGKPAPPGVSGSTNVPVTTLSTIAQPSSTGANEPAKLTCDLCLRDRDFVRLQMSTPEDRSRPATILCVGDKCMLRVTEPITYPQSQDEFRKRFLPGEYDAGKAGSQYVAPLRDPSLPHEFTNSGLDRLGAQFKQKYIPTAYEDIIPYKYVLPPTERNFLEESRPGQYWRIVDDMVKLQSQKKPASEEEKEKMKSRGKYPPMIVERLSHLEKNVPCTVLAVYPTGTCDLEISPSFMHEWERLPTKKYEMPGTMKSEAFKDTSTAAMRAAPTGTGDVGERSRKRILLKQVPLASVMSVQMASFNIYDARFKDTDEALKVHPTEARNDFNPRDTDDIYPGDTRRRGAYSISAGPLPADAGAVCQYEWALHLHAATEDDMYQFVTMLRQFVRMDLAQQVQKMKEYKSKSAIRSQAINYTTGPTLTTASGTLEVVLVEARSLVPTRVQNFRDLQTQLRKMATSDMSPYATFELLTTVEAPGTTSVLQEDFKGGKTITVDNADQYTEGSKLVMPKPSPGAESQSFMYRIDSINVSLDGSAGELTLSPLGTYPRVNIVKGTEIQELKEAQEQLVYRGSKLQTAPAVQGTNNPDWSKMKDLQSSGGWAFKSAQIEPSEHRDLMFELKILHKGILGGDVIGSVKVPLLPSDKFRDKGVPRVNLCDPKEPFNNLWLPLHTTDDKGERVPKESGEVHILTLWVPKQQTGLTKRLPKTPRAFLAHTLRPKQLASQIREPIYDLHLRKSGYNPNTQPTPGTKADSMARHTETLLTSMPYYECCERQQYARWKRFLVEDCKLDDKQLESNFRQAFESLEVPITDQLAQAYNSLGMPSEEDKLYTITELLRRGLPSRWRKDIWNDITDAKRVRDKALGQSRQSSAQIYQDLVDTGLPWRGESMVQLQEDLVGAAVWEPSVSAPVRDMHMQRLKSAQDVITALICYTLHIDTGDPPFADPKSSVAPTALRTPSSRFQNTPPNCAQIDPKATSISYCEGLLVLAFTMLLPQSHGENIDKLQKESDVFWLLYTLICSPDNGLLREYYGAPPGYPRSSTGETDEVPLCDRSGVMEDVLRLDKCVARWEPEVWVHTNALGFHLSMVFFTAFQRLYTTFLPTATLFRYWDLLFAQSKDPRVAASGKPRRHALIDLAFAVIQACKTELLKCQSALEVKQCLVDYMEKLYDPTKVVAMTAEAERSLWEGTIQKKTGIVLHTMDFDKSARWYDMYLEQFRTQNKVMQKLTRTIQLKADFFGQRSTMSDLDRRITTRNVVNYIIPALSNLLKSEGDKMTDYGGCFRPTTREVLQDGAPDVDQSHFGLFKSIVFGGIDKIITDTSQTPLAIPIKPMPGSAGEPRQLNRTQFQSQVQRGLGHEWTSLTQDIFGAFSCYPEKERMSLNEFFTALICCSKGTVGDKALALFHVYGSSMPAPKMSHITPTTHYTRALMEKVEGAHEQHQVAMYRAPKAEDVPKETALHFRIYTHVSGFASRNVASDSEGLLMGEVFIPTLKPFLFSVMPDYENTQTFSIWGTETDVPTGQRAYGASHGASHPSKVRPYIGEMKMAIKWVPVDPIKEPSKGQLGIHIEEIRFDYDRVSDIPSKNPKVTVCTYDKDGNPVKINRWDPRSALRKAGSALTMEIEFGGAFGGSMGWEETMRRDALGQLHHKVGAGEGQGFDGNSGLWKWNKKWGDQYSVYEVQFEPKFVEVTRGYKSISLKACRMITQAILNRGLALVTNRQAYMLADSFFNRAGATPAILDACLVKADVASSYVGKSLADLKDTESEKSSWVDVKHQILIAYETMCANSFGNMNLWSAQTEKGDNFDTIPRKLDPDLKITDPFPGSNKILWIRYARAGDGERRNKKIEFDGHGNISGDSFTEMDMQLNDNLSKQLMLLTKEEFVSCLIGSPLLSETLRQLSTADVGTKYVPEGKPIKLNVTIADPTQKEKEEDFFDNMNVRQSIIFEIWDFDRTSKDDFLGECWLPPIGNLSEMPKQFVLPIQNAQSRTRPDKRKNSIKQCTGDLVIEASWKFPAEKPPEGEGAVTIDERIKEEELKHTGLLELKIIRAEGLRYADVRRSKGSDPYVVAYIRNEAIAMDREDKPMNVVLTLKGQGLKPEEAKKAVAKALNQENEGSGVQAKDVSAQQVSDGTKISIYTMGKAMSGEVQTRLKVLELLNSTVKTLSQTSYINSVEFPRTPENAFQVGFEVQGLPAAAMSKVQGDFKTDITDTALAIMGSDVKPSSVDVQIKEAGPGKAKVIISLKPGAPDEPGGVDKFLALEVRQNFQALDILNCGGQAGIVGLHPPTVEDAKAEDPNEKGWRKSPVTGFHSELFRTNWKKGTINPRWDEKFEMKLMTGAFEKKTKMMLNPALTSRQEQRKKDDYARKVLGEKDEIQIYFGLDEAEKKEKKIEMGAQHSVKVYKGETIHQFKAKLKKACLEEAALAKQAARQNAGQAKEKWSDHSNACQAIADAMSSRHAVMVFVPSKQLRELSEQRRQSAHEYNRLYQLEMKDPSSWQPLEPIRTFEHYAAPYGLCHPNQAQSLRINEGTEDYKLRNHRYRQFVEDQKTWSVTVADTNTESSCYGWGLYTHKQDGGSTEWRPAIFDRTKKGSDKGARIYEAKFICTSPEAKAELKEQDVLLAPTLPQVLGSSNLQHREYLAKAPALHDSGLSAVDITKQLNSEMQMKYAVAAKDVQRPEPITLQEVQHYLRASDIGGFSLPQTAAEPRAAAPEAPAAPTPAAAPAPAAAANVGPGAGPGVGPAGPGAGKGALGKGGPAMGAAGGKAGPAMGKGGKAGPSMGPSMGPGGKGKAGPGMGPGGGGVSMGPGGGGVSMGHAG